jgi:hypothetical protein
MISFIVNKRHRAVLEAIFQTPTPANVPWREVESLFRALGAVVQERAGSWIGVMLNGVARVFHRPHPRPEIPKATLRDVRGFLVQAGIQP